MIEDEISSCYCQVIVPALWSQSDSLDTASTITKPGQNSNATNPFTWTQTLLHLREVDANQIAAQFPRLDLLYPEGLTYVERPGALSLESASRGYRVSPKPHFSRYP
jgi:hypothetical protein